MTKTQLTPLYQSGIALVTDRQFNDRSMTERGLVIAVEEYIPDAILPRHERFISEFPQYPYSSGWIYDVDLDDVGKSRLLNIKTGEETKINKAMLKFFTRYQSDEYYEVLQRYFVDVGDVLGNVPPDPSPINPDKIFVGWYNARQIYGMRSTVRHIEPSTVITKNDEVYPWFIIPDMERYFPEFTIKLVESDVYFRRNNSWVKVPLTSSYSGIVLVTRDNKIYADKKKVGVVGEAYYENSFSWYSVNTTTGVISTSSTSYSLTSNHAWLLIDTNRKQMAISEGSTNWQYKYDPTAPNDNTKTHFGLSSLVYCDDITKTVPFYAFPIGCTIDKYIQNSFDLTYGDYVTKYTSAREFNRAFIGITGNGENRYVSAGWTEQLIDSEEYRYVTDWLAFAFSVYPDDGYGNTQVTLTTYGERQLDGSLAIRPRYEYLTFK